MSYGLDRGAGSLYCLNTDLAVSKKVGRLTIPNGMAWSADRKTMYLIDTIPGEIYAYDYVDSGAAVTNRSLIRKVPESEGYPDGMTIDSEGYLWIALYGGGKIIRIDPAGGEVDVEVIVPVPKPTSCTFGGERFNALYITTARENMTGEELNSHPLSGSLFRAELPFKGLPANRFAG